MPHIKSGKRRALAVTTMRRVEQLPQLPTFTESGYEEYEINSWQALFSPAATPSDIVMKINTAVGLALKQNDLRERLDGLGAIAVGNSPEQARALVKSEIQKWARVVKAAKIRVD